MVDGQVALARLLHNRFPPIGRSTSIPKPGVGGPGTPWVVQERHPAWLRRGLPDEASRVAGALTSSLHPDALCMWSEFCERLSTGSTEKIFQGADKSLRARRHKAWSRHLRSRRTYSSSRTSRSVTAASLLCPERRCASRKEKLSRSWGRTAPERPQCFGRCLVSPP